LDEGATLRREAWTGARVQPERWEAKIASARSALGIAEALIDSDATVPPELAAKVRELRSELDADARDLQLAQALERILLKQTSPGHRDTPDETWSEEYRAALAPHRIVPFVGPPQIASAIIQERPIEMQEALIEALDEWAAILGESRQADRQWLTTAAHEADWNRWRKRIRTANAARDVDELKRLAHHPEVIRRFPSGLRILTRALIRAGQRDAAIDVLRRAHRRSPGEFWINRILADVLEREKVPEATAYRRIANALRAQAADTYNSHGLTMDIEGDVDGAVTAFRRAIEIRPDHMWAYLNLAAALWRKQDHAGAVTVAREALRVDPNWPEVRNRLAGMLIDKPGRGADDIREAIRTARKAIELAPEDAELWSTLGYALYRDAEFEESVKALEQSYELDRSFSTYESLYLSMAYWQTGRRDEARKLFGQVDAYLKRLPPNYEPLERLHDEARRALESEKTEPAKTK
jgi:Flp pilus assembly protein TadD